MKYTLIFFLIVLVCNTHYSQTNCFLDTIDVTSGGPEGIGACASLSDTTFLFLGGGHRYPFTDSNRYQFLFTLRTDVQGNNLGYREFRFPNQHLGTGYYANLISHQGGFIMAGALQDSNYTKNLAWIAKLDSLGDTLWFRIYGPELYYSGLRGITACNNGDIIACGLYGVQGQKEKIRLMRFDASGNLLWDKLHGYPGYENDAFAILEAPDGGFLIGGRTTFGGGSSSFETRALILRTDSAGNDLNKFILPGGPWGTQMISTMTYSPDGYLILGGSRSLNIFPYYTQILIAKSDWYGSFIWEKLFGYPENTQPPTPSVFCQPNGDILFCDTWRDSSGNISEFLAKLNPNGDSIWIRRYAPINGFLLNYIFDFAKIELDGGFFLTGFGHQDSNAYQDAFIMRVDSNGLMNDCFPVGLAPEIEQTLFLVYPNPANHILNVSMQLPGKNEIVELEIFDMTGKVLRRNWFSEKLHQTDISDLTTGIYLYKITSSSGVQASGKFLKN